MRARVADWIVKYRWALLAIWILHTFLIHYFVIGFVSWDGFGHRGFPVIELLQHGSLGTDKFYEWSLVGYTPFLELVHLPFLYLFGMRGFIIGFPLVVLPLCIVAVYAMLHELTADKRTATFGALTYAAIPMINDQAFSAYIDFAVVGVLAYWLFALLRLRSPERRGRTYAHLFASTFMFTMCRSQGPYVVTVMFPLLAYALLFTRERFKLRIPDKRTLVIATLVVIAAAAPSIAFQIHKYFTYGSPVAPMQLSFLGIKIGKGVTMSEYFRYAGLGDDALGSLLKGFWEGWVWHTEWPIGAFYGSRFMATGLLFPMAVLSLPLFWRKGTRIAFWILGTGLLVSLLSRDFAVPRWGYTTMISMTIVLGGSMSYLVTSARWKPLFWIGLSVLGLHLLRPELDVVQLKTRKWLTPQLNVTGSHHFVNGGWNVPIYPDGNYQLAVIGATDSNFIVQLYGRRLTNEIAGTLLAYQVGPRCEGLRQFTALHPDVIYVDDGNVTASCARVCVIPGGDCRGWRIPGP